MDDTQFSDYSFSVKNKDLTVVWFSFLKYIFTIFVVDDNRSEMEIKKRIEITKNIFKKLKRILTFRERNRTE